MKVFISWSGNRSKAVAEVLSEWLKCVIQAIRPWISTRDIDRGALWFSEISGQLQDTAVGIVCLTKENKNKPWILFEAGALAKGLSSSRVCTFLIDLKSTDLEDPLAQFNHTFPEKNSVWELVRTLNGSLAAAGLDERILAQVFDTYWGQFETRFKQAIDLHPSTAKAEQRSDENILAEILENTRRLNHRINRLERSPFEKTHGDGVRVWSMSDLEEPTQMIVRMLESGLSDEEILDQLAMQRQSSKTLSHTKELIRDLRRLVIAPKPRDV